jgi:hypothetical protein
MPTVTYNRYRFRCPVCKAPCRPFPTPDAVVECEDDDGVIHYYHLDCYDKALEDGDAVSQ